MEFGSRGYFRLRHRRAKLNLMAFHVTPDLEAKLDELAQRTHRDKSELLEEAVNNLVAYNQWFERKVNASQEAADQGDVVADKDVRGWLERRERS